MLQFILHRSWKGDKELETSLLQQIRGEERFRANNVSEWSSSLTVTISDTEYFNYHKELLTFIDTFRRNKSLSITVQDLDLLVSGNKILFFIII